MGRLNRSAIAMACAAALLSAGSAHADLLEYSFKGAGGSQRSLGPSDKYANPVGKIKFSLGAGLDRKVKISILNDKGKTISSATSKLLGAKDRISVNGKIHYGAVLSLDAPPEGAYKLKAETLSSQGAPVRVDEYPLVVDVTKPSITGSPLYKSSSSWNKSTLNVFGGGAASISIDGISDNDAIEGAYFVSKLNGSSKEILTRVAYENGKAVQVGSIPASGFEKTKGDYTVGFRVFDKAGNSNEKLWKAFIDTSPSSEYSKQWEVVAARATSSDAWIPYTKGMKAPANPMQVAWGYKNELVAQVNGTNDGIHVNSGNSNLIATPEFPNHRVYIHSLYDYNGSKYTASSKFTGGAWFRVSHNKVAEKFDFSELSKAPKPKGLQYQDETSSSWKNGFGKWIVTNKPVKVTKIRGTAEVRDYPQKFTVSGVGSCMIPAGDETCEANTNFTVGTTKGGYSAKKIAAADSTGKLGSTHQGYLYTRWDTNPLILSKAVMGDTHINFRMTDQEGCDTSNCYWAPKTAWVELTDKKSGKKTRHNSTSFSRTNAKNWDVSFNHKNYAEGVWDISIGAVDNFGNITEQALEKGVTFDRTAPKLSINGGEKGSITTLDDFSVALTDNFDKTPKLTSILLEGGPANDKVQLSWRKQSSGVYKLEYPIMFPSLAEGETYKLTVKGQDDTGNQATEVVSFKYEPSTASLVSGMDGKILIPAINQQFTRPDGGHVIQTEPITLSDGSFVNGKYDVMATLRSDADVPLVVNGIEIQPGETMSVISQHDFSKSNGRIDLPVRPIKSGVAGKANLMIMTSAPNSPVVIADINVWDAKAKLSADSWDVRQIIDPVRITASPEVGTVCRFTSDERTAKKADPIRDPVCLIEWDEKPEDVEQVFSDSNGLRLASLRGQAAKVGTEPISYSLYLFSGDGRKVKVGSGNKDLNVTSAMNSVTFKPRGEIGTVHRVIQDIDVSLEQATGPDCRLTTDDQRAQVSAEYGSSEFSGHCLLEWLEVPDGMQQQDGTDRPVLIGRLEEEKKHTLNWRVSSFSKSGTRVTLAEESFDINAISPPEPEVSIESALHFKDNIYMVPSGGGYLGDLYVLGEQANIDLLIKNGDTTDLNETFRSSGRFNNKIYRRLEAKQAPLWSETALDVTAKYTDLPSVTKSKSIKAIAVPDYNVEPRLTIDETTVLDSVPLPVVVNMVNKLKPNQEYDEGVIGQWEVRLGRDKGFNDFEPLTEFKLAENGEATFDADLTGSNRSAKLMAEARLVSPVKGYERSELSQRIFVTVLRGGEIESGIKSRRLSGPAPFTTVLQLDLKDSLDRTATGDVVWEVSKDDGESWETTKVEDRSRFRWHQSYDRGVYKVRAKTTNSNSGAEAYTETVEIIAYNVPKVDIEGPRTVFAGDEANYKVVVTDSEGNVLDDAVIKWSEDRGKTFTHEGDSITLASDNVERMSMEAWVRDSTAPDDDRLAYTKGRVSTDFKEIRKPKIYTTGPRIVEVGEEYEFSARINPPFRGMEVEMNGEFTLPNGDTVKGDTVKYTPTDEDLQGGGLELQYTAWVEGFKDEGAIHTQSIKSRVWKYVWPNFKLNLVGRTMVAPTEMDARTRTIGFRGNLDEVKYTWDIPEGVEVVSDQWDEKRPLKFNTAGTFLIKATISDARGNETVLEEEVEIAEADPFDIDVTTTTSNSFNRAPLELRLRPRVSGGHPRDRVTNLEYKVNGEVMETVGQSARAVLDAGDYDIDIKATSLMGVETVETLNFSVNENKLPVCSIDVNDRASSWAFFAECSDEDGKMKSYEWEVDGDKVSVRSNRLTLLKGSHDGIMPSVALVGYDDSNGASDKVTAAPPAE